MHGPIRDRLEDLLQAATPPLPKDSLDHLAQCNECAGEVDSLRAQSRQLEALRAPGIIEPSAGFYARVIQRIEEQQGDTIWSIFIESTFGKRLVVASLTAAIALGSYVVTQENREGRLGSGSIVAQTGSLHQDFLVMGSQTEQRDAVLVNFVEHQGEVR